MGSLYLAVEPGCAGLDVDVVDAPVQHVPVKRRGELRTVVGLDRLDGERQLGQDVAEELDRGLLVVARVDLEDPQPGAVVDRGELVELPAAADRRDLRPAPGGRGGNGLG